MMKDEMDILREVSSISAAHGQHCSLAKSSAPKSAFYAGLRIPAARGDLNKLPKDPVVLSVNSHDPGRLKGIILFILSEQSAFQLIDLCYEEKKSRQRPAS